MRVIFGPVVPAMSERMMNAIAEGKAAGRRVQKFVLSKEELDRLREEKPQGLSDRSFQGIAIELE